MMVISNRHIKRGEPKIHVNTNGKPLLSPKKLDFYGESVLWMLPQMREYDKYISKLVCSKKSNFPRTSKYKRMKIYNSNVLKAGDIIQAFFKR